MSDVIVIGGAINGLSTAMLLAKDGHRVRVLERDPGPPPDDPAGCWTGWDRSGVGQFRQLHGFLPRWRQTIEAELPEVAAAMDRAGALRTNSVHNAPPELTGGPRPGDERFELLTARRPVMEAALARTAAATPGVTVERGVSVTGLVDADRPAAPGVPHVTGVATGDGRRLQADLVVDAGGRRSPLPRWLAGIGARPVVEEREDSGFRYYARHFRSGDGSVPPAFGPPLQPYDSLSLALLPADNGTWGVGIVTSAKDTALRAARREDVWTRLVKHYPLAAHWLEGEPISGVDVFTRIEDRHRRFFLDGAPVATGVVAVGDAWACTNPSVGRGASIGLLHAVALRDVLREVGPDDALGLARRWDRATDETVEPLFRDTLTFDRHRLAEIDAQVAGVPYETDDPAWFRNEALRRGAPADPDVFRAYAAVRCLLDRLDDAWAQPGIAAKAGAAVAADPPPAPGPTRSELVALATA